ncbi:hypothetical protein DAPPUDRAFT_253166 [Daphnia pulex]|uniref:Uncharacterized protein n=1 Tax=Daphnia pulex TaxID=6669 RepID=E9H4A1_DAPPU|nr:hypothetical protein DAPPUDRAFT_253166 [Daphnia pulex]|eukprot:EFX73343.1 hypothetical protein DAPPUDRAFT_253166 [Daphnia pulex]
MTSGISTEASKAISKEFPIEFIDTDFAIKPPKLDGWIGRRAQSRPDKGLLKTINATEDSLTKAQLKIMDIEPPLIDLYSRLSSLQGSDAAKRSVQAALQQWDRAFFHITRKRRSAVIALAEPASEYLLRDPGAFESGKESRSFLLTEKFPQAMLTDASQDNTLAQAARVAEAAAAAIAPKSQNPRRYRFPPEQAAAPFQKTTRYDGIQGSRGGRGGRGRRGSRGRGQRHNAWLQGG